jgi:hypothetical protein
MENKTTQTQIEFEKWAMGKLHLSKSIDSPTTYLFWTTEAAWQAWQEASEAIPVQTALGILKAEIQSDNSLAWAWHCNVAMPLMDESGSHEMANRAAARFMQIVFDIDVTNFDEWLSFDWVKGDKSEKSNGENRV